RNVAGGWLRRAVRGHLRDATLTGDDAHGLPQLPGGLITGLIPWRRDDFDGRALLDRALQRLTLGVQRLLELVEGRSDALQLLEKLVAALLQRSGAFLGGRGLPVGSLDEVVAATLGIDRHLLRRHGGVPDQVLGLATCCGGETVGLPLGLP